MMGLEGEGEGGEGEGRGGEGGKKRCIYGRLGGGGGCWVGSMHCVGSCCTIDEHLRVGGENRVY